MDVHLFWFLSLVFAVFNLLVNNLPLVGGLEVGFSLLCLYIFKHSQKHYPKRWHAITMCLTISLIVLCGTYLAPLKTACFCGHLFYLFFTTYYLVDVTGYFCLRHYLFYSWWCYLKNCHIHRFQLLT